jgi:hypothetical protein
LLSSYLVHPLYMSTITVGRKFSAVTCRRALCCRLEVAERRQQRRRRRRQCGDPTQQQQEGTTTTNPPIINLIHPKTDTTTTTTILSPRKVNDIHNDADVIIATNIVPSSSSSSSSSQEQQHPERTMFQLHHPTIMGTSVYMDDDGVIDMSTTTTVPSITGTQYTHTNTNTATPKNNDNTSNHSNHHDNDDTTTKDRTVSLSAGTSSSSSSATTMGQVRFHSSMSFVTWLQPKIVQRTSDHQPEKYNNNNSNNNNSIEQQQQQHHDDDPYEYEMECIDGSTGLLWVQQENTLHPPSTIPVYPTSMLPEEGEMAHNNNHNHNQHHTIRRRRSKISTAALVEQFGFVESLRQEQYRCDEPIVPTMTQPSTLPELRRLKRMVAPTYEQTKYDLLTKHPVLRDWKRRRFDSIDETIHGTPNETTGNNPPK